MSNSYNSFPNEPSDSMLYDEQIPEPRSEEYLLLMGLRDLIETDLSETSIKPILRNSRTERGKKLEPIPEKNESLQSLKLCQKLECVSYKDVNSYAQLFVDEIIDISIGVCNKVNKVLGRGVDTMKSYGEGEGGEQPDTSTTDDEGTITFSLERFEIFEGWPRIEEFTVDLGVVRIDQFMSQWKRKEAWKYSVTFIASWSDVVSDFHLYKISIKVIVDVILCNFSLDQVLLLQFGTPYMYANFRFPGFPIISPSDSSLTFSLIETEKNKPPKERSIDDIDELTLTLARQNKPPVEVTPTVGTIISVDMKTDVEGDPNFEVDVTELPQHVEVSSKTEEIAQGNGSGEETLEEPTSEISISDKIKCIRFGNLEDFAQLFVDEIIDISVEVCENLYDAAYVGEGDLITERPCICDTEEPIPEPVPPICKDSMEFDLEKSLLSSVEKKTFSGWPTINHFTIEGAKKRILEFMDQWYFVEDWKYTVHYMTSYSDTVSDYHLFQGMWSIPTKEYPIAQATATIFFTIEVSRVKPKFCLVNVTLQFEGSSSIYRAGQFEFIEQWLFNIIDSKLNLFKTLRF